MREAAIVSTCNRVEIYGAFSDCDEAVASVRGLLAEQLAARRAGAGRRRIRSCCWARHVYARRAARGLAPPVPGVGLPGLAGDRRAADPGPDQGGLRAGRAGRAPPGRCWDRCFRAPSGWPARSGATPASPTQQVSVSSVAVDLARQVWGGFAGPARADRRRRQDGRPGRAGAGPRGGHPGRHQPDPGARRGAGRSGCRRRSSPGRTWPGRVVRADIVISSTGAREPILRKRLLDEPAAHAAQPAAGADRHRRPARHRAVGGASWTASTCSTSTTCRRWWPTTWRTAARRPTGPRRWSRRSWPASWPPIAAGPPARPSPPCGRGPRRWPGPRWSGCWRRCRPATSARARALRALADAIVAKLLHAPWVALKKDAGERRRRQPGRGGPPPVRSAAAAGPGRRSPRRDEGEPDPLRPDAARRRAKDRPADAKKASIAVSDRGSQADHRHARQRPGPLAGRARGRAAAGGPPRAGRWSCRSS